MASEDDRGWPKEAVAVVCSGYTQLNLRDNREDPGPAALICRNARHLAKDRMTIDGPTLVFLTYKQYEYQLSRPDSKWECPMCGSVASWDDHCRETDPPDEE
jgi:hypothetical protein